MEFVKKNRTFVMIVAVAVVAVIVVAGVLLAASSPTSSVSALARYAEIPQSRLPDGGFVLGYPDAPVTVVEFADFACPHCQNYSVEMKRFIDEYVATGQAKLEYRMFISGADPTYGPYTAQLAECAAELREGGFWPAHDVLFDIGRAQVRYNEQTARTLAERLDLNYSELLNCADGARQSEVDVRLGQSLGVQSTPTLMVRTGNSEPRFITLGGQTFNRGGAPYQVLQAVVENAQ
jgi:protein-disulfide isomerase